MLTLCRYGFILIIFFVGLLQTAWSQTRSLHYYLSHAIQNSPAIARQINKADSVRLQKKIIHAQLDLPLISASGTYLYAPFVGDHFGYAAAITNGGDYAALLNIKYPLFTHKRKKVRYHAASIALNRSSYHIQKLKHALIDTVTHQYIRSFESMKNLQYLGDIIKLLKQQKRWCDRWQNRA